MPDVIGGPDGRLLRCPLAYREAGDKRAQCPNAGVVFNPFHVVAQDGLEVIDRVRVNEANLLHHEKAAWKVVKGSRWRLRSNGQRLLLANKVPGYWSSPRCVLCHPSPKQHVVVTWCQTVPRSDTAKVLRC